jgi:hypothetical protein
MVKFTDASWAVGGAVTPRAVDAIPVGEVPPGSLIAGESGWARRWLQMSTTGGRGRDEVGRERNDERRPSGSIVVGLTAAQTEVYATGVCGVVKARVTSGSIRRRFDSGRW